MFDSSIQVPAELTTEGLLVRRYLAWQIDSALIMLVVAAAVRVESAVPPSNSGGSASSHLGILS